MPLAFQNGMPAETQTISIYHFLCYMVRKRKALSKMSTFFQVGNRFNLTF